MVRFKDRSYRRFVSLGFEKILILATCSLCLVFFSSWAYSQEVVIVKLRMPTNQTDKRFDPYYEAETPACFGITRCHRSNVMHPDRVFENLVGKRVAFVQGGLDPVTHVSQQRLILMTPILTQNDIEIVGRGEARVALIKWNGYDTRPLKFASSPVLVANDGSGLQSFIEMTSGSKRPTPVAAFGSLFRTRIQPLNPELSHQLIELWERATVHDTGQFALNYWETMSPEPRLKDLNRKSSFARYFSQANSCSETL